MSIDFSANATEKAVVCYLIDAVRAGKSFRAIDKSFLNHPDVRGNRAFWCTIMGSIRGQLNTSPESIEGYSITPPWVRDVYKEYWTNPEIFSWCTTASQKPTMPDKLFYYGYTSDNANQLTLVPCVAELPEEATKKYKVILTEIVDTE